MKNAYIKKSKSDNWATPRYLFEETCKQFNVFPDLDVCASELNRKCWYYFDENTDGLKQQWDQTFWMNPPFSNAGKWIEYAFNQHRKWNVSGIALLASRTDTKAWHKFIFNDPNCEVIFLEGRIKYLDENNIESKNPSPFPSAVVCWNKF